MSQDEDLYRAIFPDDGHLASSKSTDDAFRGTVLDNETNTLQGQAEFVKVEMDDEHSERDEDSPEVPPLA